MDHAEAHTGRVAVDGGEIEYDLIGRADAGGRAPLVFLHGWTLDRRMWAPQRTGFGDRPVVVVDRRGCGRSTAQYDLDREREDVIALIDRLGFEAAVLVGMSQAGHVAAEVASVYPSRVAGLVLQGVRLGPAAARGEPDIPLGEYRGLVRAGRLEAMKALWREHALMRPTDPRVQPEIDAMLDRYDGADLVRDNRPRPALDGRALARLGAPSLIITGEHETELRHAVAAELATTLADAARVEIKGAGHMCNMCAPTAYNAALANFLKRL